MSPGRKDNHEATKIAKKKPENIDFSLALYPLLRVLRAFVVNSVAEAIFRTFLGGGAKHRFIVAFGRDYLRPAASSSGAGAKSEALTQPAVSFSPFMYRS